MNILRRPTLAPLCLVLALASLGCDDSMEDGMDSDTEAAGGTETAGPDGIDEAGVQAMAADFDNLSQVSDVPTSSQHALADTVTFYAADDVVELYRTLDPEAPAAVTFPEGALLVKENLDANGESSGYFAMYKGPEGYDPTGNDWYWLQVNGAGAVGNAGKVGFCKDCHGGGSAAVSDYVFGVPLDNRL